MSIFDRRPSFFFFFQETYGLLGSLLKYVLFLILPFSPLLPRFQIFLLLRMSEPLPSRVCVYPQLCVRLSF